MATDIKLEESDVVVEGHALKVRGVDLVIDGGDERRPNDKDPTHPRRALVHDFDDSLAINYAKDYPGGVKVQGPVAFPDGASAASLSVEGQLLLGPSGFKTETIHTPRGDIRQTVPQIPLDVGEALAKLDRLWRIRQDSWWACKTCHGVFSEWPRAKTECAAFRGGGGCDRAYPGSAQYALHHTITRYDGQPGWMCCFKCKGLFFGKNATTGVCPVDLKGHEGSGSYDFVLFEETQEKDFSGVKGFRWCKNCQGLFLLYPGDARQGVCPASAGGHDGSASSPYELQMA